jgi:hypothetical protein
MAQKKISELIETTSLTVSADLLPVVSEGDTKKVTVETILNYVPEVHADLFTAVQENSATNWNYQGTDLKDLSGNWENTYTTVNTNSATNWDNALTLSYVNATFLPLTGGALTGAISLSNVDVQPGETLTDSLSSLIITINGQQFKIPLLSV